MEGDAIASIEATQAAATWYVARLAQSGTVTWREAAEIRFGSVEPFTVDGVTLEAGFEWTSTTIPDGVHIPAAYTFAGDSGPLDAAPHLCWRCDSSDATTAIGLCSPCRADLA